MLIEMKKYLGLALVVFLVPSCNSIKLMQVDSHFNSPFYKLNSWESWIDKHADTDTLIAFSTSHDRSRSNKLVLIAYFSEGEWWSCKARQNHNHLQFGKVYHLAGEFGGLYLKDHLNFLLKEVAIEPNESLHGGYSIQIHVRVNDEIYSEPYFQLNGGKINGLIEQSPTELFMYYSIINNNLR